MKKKVVSKKSLKKDDKYYLSLKMADKLYEYKGDTLLECLEQIKPDVIKSKGVLIVKKGKAEAHLLLHPFDVKRIITNKTKRTILNKQLNLAMGIKL